MLGLVFIIIGAWTWLCFNEAEEGDDYILLKKLGIFITVFGFILLGVVLLS